MASKKRKGKTRQPAKRAAKKGGQRRARFRDAQSSRGDYEQGYADRNNPRVPHLDPKASRAYQRGWFDAKDGKPPAGASRPTKRKAPARKTRMPSGHSVADITGHVARALSDYLDGRTPKRTKAKKKATRKAPPKKKRARKSQASPRERALARKLFA